MSRVMLVMDNPCNCMECPFHFRDELVYVGDYTYKQFYKCRMCPEDVEDYYLPDILKNKPDWCIFNRLQFPEYKDESFNKTQTGHVYNRGWNDCLKAIEKEKYIDIM